MNHDDSKQLEQAIATLQRFTEPLAEERVPALHHFELHNGTLELKPLSAIEKTLSCLMEAVFSGKRKEKSKQQRPIQATVLASVDIVKIALMKQQHGQLVDQTLYEQLVKVVRRYNAIVNCAKSGPKTLAQRMKHFFFKAAGWLIDEEMQQSEISLPSTSAPHRFKNAPQDTRTQKIASVMQYVVQPQKQEIELFYVKAHTLLKQETLFNTILDDALASLRTAPLEATLSSQSILSLQGIISPFPGEVIELKGDFSRTRALSIPIKESFKITSRASQTGYPHPLQHIGLAFSEKLLPRMLLRPLFAPNIAAFLKKKQKIAEQLLPNGALNAKAKSLLAERKKIFLKNKHELLTLQKKYVQALFTAAHVPLETIEYYFSSLKEKDNFFEEMSILHAKIRDEYIDKPCTQLGKSWLEGAPLDGSPHKTEVDFTQNSYVSDFGAVLTQVIHPIMSLIFSEHMGCKPAPLDNFSKKVLQATFQEQMDFMYELEEIEPESDLLREWIFHLMEKKAMLFSPEERPCPLAEDFERYSSYRTRE